MKNETAAQNENAAAAKPDRREELRVQRIESRKFVLEMATSLHDVGASAKNVLAMAQEFYEFVTKGDTDVAAAPSA